MKWTADQLFGVNVTILRRKFARHLLIGLTQCTEMEFTNFPSDFINDSHCSESTGRKNGKFYICAVQYSVQTGYNVTKERQSAIEIACHKKLCHLLHKTKSFDARATSEYQRVKKFYSN